MEFFLMEKRVHFSVSALGIFVFFCRADLSWGIWAVGRWDGPHHPGQFRENDHYDPGEFPLVVTLGQLPRHRDPAEPGRVLHLYTEDTEGPASRARGEHREAVRAPRTGPPPPFYLRKQLL